MPTRDDNLEDNFKNQPAMLKRSFEVYKTMEDHAKSDGERLIYEGFLTLLFKELDYSNSYYSKVRQLLIQMGCIEQIVRGGSHTPSVYLLKHPPTQELFNNCKLVTYNKDQKYADLLLRLAHLEDRVEKIENGTI